jgi:hypothetical protein
MSHNRLEELATRIARQRVMLKEDVKGLAWHADLPSRVKDTVRERPSLWVAGALAAGAVTAILPGRIFRRKKRVASPPSVTDTASQKGRTLNRLSVLLPVLKVLFPMVRPALAQWTADALSYWTKRR